MGKRHTFVFNEKFAQERANEELNKEQAVLARGREYIIPFKELVSVERGKFFEIMGEIEQEIIRKENIEKSLEMLERTKIKWSNFYSAYSKPGKSGQHPELWEKFLNYNKKKSNFRLGLTTSQKNLENRKILSRHLSKNALVWDKEAPLDATPRAKIDTLIQKKQETIVELGDKIEGLECTEYREALAELIEEIEREYGICTQEDLDSTILEVKKRVMSYLKVQKKPVKMTS